jgi:Asp-tRNA(Asn)/Glu-tRNA(Gln) amidotransferase A subunit family amidase
MAGDGGLSAHEKQPAIENTPMVDKLLAAGAILHAQTAAPELCFIPPTWSRLCGVTRKPWSLADYRPAERLAAKLVMLCRKS